MESNYNLTAIFAEIVPDQQFELTTHNLVIENKTYKVETHSNSTISNLIFNSTLGIIQFNVEGTTGTIGLCNITIPAELMSGDFLIYKDGTQLTKNVDYTERYNDNYYLFTITYEHNTHLIEIISTNVIPEFPSMMLLLVSLFTFAILGIIFQRKITKTSKKYQF